MPSASINQILQSPGIYYQSELNDNGISVYTGTIISDWGGRLELEMDRKARIWVRVSHNVMDFESLEGINDASFVFKLDLLSSFWDLDDFRDNNLMADLNIHVNDAPVEQAPDVAPPTKIDDQILPLSKAFTTSFTIPAIYIQQFWDTMYFNLSTGLYSCQLDEKWFNLHKEILKDALNITPANDNNPFVDPPSSDAVIEYVNTLGYPSTLRNVSAMSINALYQPWRAVLSMINMCLTGKTAGYDKPRHPVIQILWGIIHHSNIDYAKRIWEEFVQSIQTFLTDRKNLTTASRRKKFVGKDGREIFGMPIPDALLTYDIKGAPYYDAYLEHVAKYQQHLDAEHGMEDEGGATESPKATKVTKPKATKETSDAPSPAKQAKAYVIEKEPAHDDEEADLQWAPELNLKDQGERTQGPARLVVIWETDSGRIQPPPDVQGKGKEKVRRTPTPTESSRHAESPSLDAELALTDSETESDEEAPEIHAGDQDEGQAGPNPGDVAESQPQSSHVVHAGPNLEHMDSEATDA
ncbi:retrovirus-related pol polyprotein from transposon TNT 1-94 [Tanacetum coccineum]